MSVILRLVLSLIAFATAASAVSAQTPEPVDDTSASFGALPGVQAGVVRVFSGDATGTASPAAAGITGVTTAILTFDTEMNAQTGMTQIQTDAQGESGATALLVGDLGDRKAAFLLEDADGAITGSVIVSQTGTEVIVVLVDGADAAVETLAIDLTTAIAETPAGTGEAVVAADGTSTGGAWDRLPTTDAVGLATVEDIAL